ncbi:hypothetical protein SDC9_202624 [bioreactor metagenome]|uniref:Uncharacterized protein n=1 Tax=bioreactor metagenome TaxID=1076179 RepID=A0A645IU42_9ZZZZ
MSLVQNLLPRPFALDATDHIAVFIPLNGIKAMGSEKSFQSRGCVLFLSRHGFCADQLLQKLDDFLLPFNI